MKKILWFAALALLISSMPAFAKGLELEKKADDYVINIKLDKNPPVVGANTASITVKDAAGKAVKDATVKVDYGMPAMPGMGAMNYKTSGELKGDGYEAKIDFSMSGPWNVTVKVTRGGKTANAKFNVDVR